MQPKYNVWHQKAMYLTNAKNIELSKVCQSGQLQISYVLIAKLPVALWRAEEVECALGESQLLLALLGLYKLYNGREKLSE